MYLLQDYLKRKKISFATYGEDLAVEVEEVELQENELTVEAIKETLAELPHGYRLVFSLYMFENMSHKEIAQHLDISEGTSKSQLNRAKQKLKEKLEEQGYGRG